MKVEEREIKVLSGGELQRFAIAMVMIQQAEIYMFDEPSSYLDVKQRLQAAHVIRTLLQPTVYVNSFVVKLLLSLLGNL